MIRSVKPRPYVQCDMKLPIISLVSTSEISISIERKDNYLRQVKTNIDIGITLNRFLYLCLGLYLCLCRARFNRHKLVMLRLMLMLLVKARL